jgi:hypothetical protein
VLIGAELVEAGPASTNSTGKRFQFIQSAVSNKCLGYDYRQTQNRVYEDECRESWPMLWAAIRVSENVYKFRNAETLDCMFAQHPTTSNTAIVGFDCDGTLEGATSEFRVSSPLPGVFSLMPSSNLTNNSLCIESGPIGSAPKMAEWPRVQNCSNGLSQKFVVGYDEDDKTTPLPTRSETTSTSTSTSTPPPPTATTVTVTRYASYPPPPPDVIVTTTTTVSSVLTTVRAITSYVECTTHETTTLSGPTTTSSASRQALGDEISDELGNQPRGLSPRDGKKLPVPYAIRLSS